MKTADARRETIAGFVSAIYSTKTGDWYTQTTERQAIAETLAGYILQAYTAREAK